MKLLPVALLILSTSVKATDAITSTLEHPEATEKHAPLALSINYVAMPNYEQLFRNIEVSKEDRRAFKRSLLVFYSALLPALRYEALALEVPEALFAYASAEATSFELVKLHLLDPETVGQDEYAFYERVVIDDSYATAQELVLNILPTIPTEETGLNIYTEPTIQEAI